MDSLPAHGRYPGAYIACTASASSGRLARKSGTSPMAPICTTAPFATGAACVLASGARGGSGDTGSVSTSRGPPEAGPSMPICVSIRPRRFGVSSTRSHAAILFVWAPQKARPLGLDTEDISGTALQAATFIAKGDEDDRKPSLRYLTLRNVSTILRQPAFEFKLGFSAFGMAG